MGVKACWCLLKTIIEGWSCRLAQLHQVEQCHKHRYMQPIDNAAPMALLLCAMEAVPEQRPRAVPGRMNWTDPEEVYKTRFHPPEGTLFFFSPSTTHHSQHTKHHPLTMKSFAVVALAALSFASQTAAAALFFTAPINTTVWT